MKRLCLFCALIVCALVSAAALDYSLTPYFLVGTGQAYGSLLSSKGDFYSEIGSSSYTDNGSSSPYFPILLGGAGADLALSNGNSWWMRGVKALVIGMELGTWGGAVQGQSSGGDDFASLQARSLVLSFSVDERFRFPIGEDYFMSLSLGPVLGLKCRYIMDEYFNGIYSSASLAPKLVEMPFLGFGIGYDFGFKLQRGNIILGLRGDLGITNLSSAEGALGDVISLPWRILARVGCELPIGEPRKGAIR